MSEDTTISRKNKSHLNDQSNQDYAATEELNFEDFEALARTVLRQQKISSVVSNHLKSQFSEYDELDKKNQLRKKQLQIDSVKKSNTDQYNNPENYRSDTQISIDSDVFEAIVLGMAQLVNNQLRFADEFGLKDDVVFSTDLKEMKNRGSSVVIGEWLKNRQVNKSSKIDSLFEDLVQHQTNILASLDTISRRTIKFLGPELTRKSVHGLAKFGPMWPHYKKRNMRLSSDKQKRYKLIISPGVAYSYEKAKKKSTSKK